MMRRYRIGFTGFPLLVMIGGLLGLAARPAEAQLGDRIVQSAKQKAQDRKERTKEHLVYRATDRVDSTLERLAAPVDTVVGRAATGAAVAVSRVGRSRAAERELEARRLSDELAATGRAGVPGITFATGTDRPEPGAEFYLSALAAALAGTLGAFLVEGRAGVAEDADGGRALGGLGAAAVKASLVAEGVTGVQLFTAGQRAEGEGAAAITVIRMQ